MDTQPEQVELKSVAEKAVSRRDFWMGFIGWWVFNLVSGALNIGLSVGLSSAFPNNSDLSNLLGILSPALGCLTLVLNIGALVFFAFRRKQVALGMLVAFGVSLAISILIGVIATVACFVILSQYNNL